MNLKKFAIRGIVFLAVFVALCIFFSGTVRTITTPKVRLTTAKRGRLEQRIELTCKLAYPKVEQITCDLASEASLTIVKVNTREGYSVQAGDVVIEAKVANFDQQRKEYQDAYDSASEQLMTLENKNRNTRINQRDQQYADAYYALRDARRNAVNLALEMDTQLTREGLSRADEGYPEGASDDLKKLIDSWRDAVKAQQEAQQAMDHAARYKVDEEVWTYITEKREQEQKRDEAEENLRKLVALNDSVKAIAAPHDGYISELNAKEGDLCENGQPLYTITAEGEMPVLRADLTDVKFTVSRDMTVSTNPDSYDAAESTIVDVGTDSEGKKYADIALTKEIINAKGSVYGMSQEETVMTLIHRAKDSTSLVPTSAVREDADDRFIYVTEQNTAAFSGGTMQLRRVNVTVAGEYGGLTSVQEDLSYYSIAYGEDRPIEEGSTVMEYLNNQA